MRYFIVTEIDELYGRMRKKRILDFAGSMFRVNPRGKDVDVYRIKRDGTLKLVKKFTNPFLYTMDDAKNWLCFCGMRPFYGGYGKWRWDGRNWQHHHPYPIGHVIAEYKPKVRK